MMQAPLPLPTTPALVLRHVIPAAMALLPQRMAGPRANVPILAIMLQESALSTRRQGTKARPGPGRGFAQFEVNGVRGVMSHVASQKYAKHVCRELGIPFEPTPIHHAMEHNDVLGAAFARLLLWTDAAALPEIGKMDQALLYYLRNWRPGAAKTSQGLRDIEARWARNYPRAVAAVAEAGC